MGYYTKFHLEGELNTLGVQTALPVLKRLLDSEWRDACDPWPDHPFFALGRKFMLCCSSYYHVPFSTSFVKEDWQGGWYFFFNCDLKNYQEEIEAFLSWLTPYVDGAVGFLRGEQCDLDPIYISDGKRVLGGEYL